MLKLLVSKFIWGLIALKIIVDMVKQNWAPYIRALINAGGVEEHLKH